MSQFIVLFEAQGPFHLFSGHTRVKGYFIVGLCQCTFLYELSPVLSRIRILMLLSWILL